MQRRKLTAFTVMYTAGIAAGCFMFEKQRPLEAICFMMALAAAVHMAGVILGSTKDRCALLAFMLAGLVIFTLRFYAYESFENGLISGSASAGSAEEPGQGASSSADESSFTGLTGRVVEVTVKDDSIRLTLRPDGAGIFAPYVYVTAKSHTGDPYEYSGCRIRAAGQYKEITGAENPGCFDNRIYRRSKGTPAAFSANSIEITEMPASLTARFRRKLIEERENFIARFSEDIREFIRGVIFGDKSGMDEELRREFNINQTGHILAVSGLHIGFLYSLLKTLSGRRKTKLASFVIISALLIYGEMTTWSPATKRACIVLSISLVSIFLKRHSDLLTSVSLAALVILVHQPYQLFDPGFQMSFLAMGGIAVFTRPLSGKLGEALGTAAAVQLGVAPAAALIYSRANLLSIFINIPIILLSSIMVPLCMILLLIRIATGIVPAAGIILIEFMVRSLIGINHFLTFGGGYSLLVAGLDTVLVISFYSFAMFAASEWTRVKLIRKEYRDIVKAALFIILPLAMLSPCCFDTLSDDEIVFVSVGQGDCTHIRAAGHDLLIDGGGQEGYGEDDEGYNVGEKVLMPYLLHSGAGRVDIAFVTHLHADHYKGIKELAEIYPVSSLGVPVDYRENDLSDVKGNTEVFYVRPDTKADITDEIYIDVLWPVKVSREPVAADDANEHNTVYMIHYKGTKIMVTGDLLEEDELKMVDYYRKKQNLEALQCDILKVAHHGSKSSSCDEFLDAAAPSIAVISVGKYNLYGHPHAETLEKLEAHGIKVFRTDQSGAVGIDISKNSLSVDLYRK